MHIISRKKLVEAVQRYNHEALGAQLDSWYRTAKAAKWQSLGDVRQTYSHADGVPVGSRVYTVFNVCGNNFRLVTEIFYENRTILIRHVLTHIEYNQEGWKR